MKTARWKLWDLATLQILWDIRVCSAQQQQAGDKMLPPDGQVLALIQPETKGLCWPSQMASTFIPPDQQRFNVPGSTWSHPLNANSSCYATTSCLRRSIHTRAVFTLLRALRIERKRVLSGSSPSQAKSGWKIPCVTASVNIQSRLMAKS